jgi:hypothetical protein
VEPAGDLTITLPALVDVPASNVDAAVTVADPPTKNRRKQRGITALISAGAAGALYGGAIGARVAYDANPSDALYTTVDGLAISSGVVGVFAGTMGIWTLATPAP